MSPPADHDQRFKALIREFFADFLHLFFADYARRFDLSTVEWLDKELLPDPPVGEKHILDMVAKLHAVEPISPSDAPGPWLALVHIEIESPDRTTGLRPRLPGYYLHLRNQYGLPVLPIVLYLKVGLDGIGVDTIVEKFWELEVNRFSYLYVGLPALDAERYVSGESWLGVALSALMRIPKERIVELGAEACLRISGAPLTELQRFLLWDCVEAYTELDDQVREQIQDIIEARASGRVQPVNKTSYDRGLEQGQQLGLVLGRRAAVLEVLEARFGAVPADLAERIAAADDAALLKNWNVAALHADTLAAFRTRVGC